jgi:hypothetical protein
MKTLSALILALVLMVISISDVSALMSSGSYRIFGDSFSSGGGTGTSGSYLLHGSAGEDFAGESSSASYVLLDGVQSLAEHPTFTFSLSQSSVAIGGLLDSAIQSGSVTATTSTNAPFGYTTTVIEDGNLRSGANDIDDVADGAVTIGSEEYGMALTGTDRAFSDDQPITTSPTLIASRANWKNGAETIVTFKASIDGVTADGTYSHELFYVSTGNF